MIGENICLDSADESNVPYFTKHLANKLRNMLSELGRSEDMDDKTYFTHLTDIFEKPIDEYTLDVALQSCKFNPDAKDMEVIRKAMKSFCFSN